MAAGSGPSVETARALVKTIPDSRWNAVAIAQGIVAVADGKSVAEAAVLMRDRGISSLKRSKEILAQANANGFESFLIERTQKGGAADPVPKLFPGRITEEFFGEEIAEVIERTTGLTFIDHRDSEHSFIDFTLCQNAFSLPINVKVASTIFRLSAQLVSLPPDDCLPIPAYKAHGAVERQPNLVYAISADFDLLDQIKAELPKLLTPQEAVVWRLLQNYEGPLVRNAEDLFVFAITKKHWQALKLVIRKPVFHIISARKAIRILNTMPKRTPGIGMRGWGTGASAEVNVHVSISEDTTPWENVKVQLISDGLESIIRAVSLKKTEKVHAPEI